MANIYARRLISTMDPLADYQAVGGRPSKVKELLHLDPNRLKEEARIASAPTHSAALERFPRRPFTRPPPPEEQMAAPAAAPSSSERPSTAPSRRDSRRFNIGLWASCTCSAATDGAAVERASRYRSTQKVEMVSQEHGARAINRTGCTRC